MSFFMHSIKKLFEPKQGKIPDGSYVTVLDEFCGDSGDGKYAVIVLKIIKGTYSGRLLSYRVNLRCLEPINTGENE